MGPAITVRIRGFRIRTAVATPVAATVVTVGVASTGHLSRLAELAIAAAAMLVTAAVLAVHEATRVLAYQRGGVTIRGIEIALVGGSPTLLDRSASPRREVAAASAGLATLALLSGAALGAARIAEPQATRDLGRLVAIAVAAIAILQTMPALPLDGGRYLRGLVWHLTNDPIQGSRAAAIYGHVIAAAMIGSGLLMMAGSDALPYWGFGAVVAGLQLVTCSAASVRDSLWQQSIGQTSLAELGLPLPVRVAVDDDIERVVDVLIDEGGVPALLVVDGAGHPSGVIGLSNLRRLRRSEWAEHRATEAMTPIGELPQLPGTMTALDALTALDRRNAQLAVVQPENGSVLLVNRELLLEQMMPRALDIPENRQRP